MSQPEPAISATQHVWDAIADVCGLQHATTRSEICIEILRHAQAGALSAVLTPELASHTTDPYLALLTAESALRRNPREVFARVTAIQSHLDSTDELATWAAALLADVALSQTSPEMLMPIVTATYPTPDTPLGRLCQLRINRARLVVLGLSFDSWPSTRVSLDQLDSQFVAMGAAEEAATTGCIRAALDVVHGQPGVEVLLEDVVATCRRLIELDTDRSSTAFLLAIGACHLAEDHEALMQVREESAIGFPVDSWQHAAVELFHSTTAYRHNHHADDLNSAEQWFTRLLQRFAQPWLLVAEAHNFLDYERQAPARMTLDLALGSGLVTPQTVAGLEALRARVEFLDHPNDAAVRALEDVVDSYATAGLRGQAAVFALRTSRDCARISRAADAERFYAKAVELVADRELSNTERRLLRLAKDPSPIAGAPKTTFLALDGAPRLLYEGNPVPLGRLATRLMTLLAGSPSGLSLDIVLESLYPDVERQLARSRFNLLLHRLRERVDSEPGELFARTDTTVQLVHDHWHVDVWDFTRKAALPSVEARLSALELYRDNFAGVDGLFDDAIIEIRQQLQVKWCDLVLGLLRDGVLDSDDVAQRADHLEIRYPRLLQALAAHHRRASIE